MVIEVTCGYSTISTQELMEKIIPSYCIEQPNDCLFWERGANDNYQVRCDKVRYSLRIYRHGIHSRDEIDFEVDALNHLHKKGFPVAYPIARKSGGYITEIIAPEGVRYVLLTAFAEGGVPDFDLLDDFKLTGKSVAHLHKASDDFKTTHKRKKIDLDLFTGNRFKSIEPHITHRPKDLAQLKQYLDTASLHLEKTGVDGMDFGFCHGDVHGGNAHLHEGVMRHFDFEECGFGYRVFDLATFKWSLKLNGETPDKWAAFVEGYESVRKIHEADLELMNTFVVLRHIWLIAFHMRNAGDFGGEILGDNYIDRQMKRLKRLSTSGIGAELATENNQCVVVRTTDGGTAHKSGQVNAGDRIVGVADGEDGKFVDVEGMELDDIVELIAGPNGTVVQLKILSKAASADSATRVVSIMRDTY